MIRKTDIREEGTGNAGASNVVMVVGGGTILALFIVNYLALATLIPLLIFPYFAWRFGFSDAVVLAASVTSLYCLYIHRGNFQHI